MKNLIDEYTIMADHVPATVNIYSPSDENVPIYDIILPKVEKATEALLEEIKDEVAEMVPVEIEDITDSKKIKILKKKFYEDVKTVLTHHMLDQNKNNHDQNSVAMEKINILSGIVLHRMFGMGFIDVIMEDNFLEELAINGSTNPISVYHKKHGWCKTTKKLENEESVYNLSSQIGRKVGREINSMHPIMDAHLLTGDRVASTLFPISTSGNTITIRRFSRNPWTITQLIDPSNKTLSVEIAAMLWQAMHFELNVLVAGGTASGKTSILSALSGLIPPNQRILTIEDTREITLPEPLHWNWVPLTTRNANPEGLGEVTMLDLMISSLRMRPDRIIVGEVRKKAQAETMFEAMHTGHSVYATIHADTAQQVKRRLIEPPISVPKQEAQALQLVLVQFRDRRKGVRRSLELVEILNDSEENLQINYLYRWQPRTDTFEKANESIRVVEELNLHTGMTPSEIEDDLSQRKQILNWMIEKKIMNIDDVGKVMSAFYKDKNLILDLVKNNKDFDLKNDQQK